MTESNFVVVPGDGIGPEVIAQAVVVLEAVGTAYGHRFGFSEYEIGASALRNGHSALPDATLEACRNADAVILGAVGSPEFDNPRATTRPEDAILGLRRELNLFANLRPIRVSERLPDIGPIKREVVAGTDILFVRELTGGLYFGEVTTGDGWVSNAMKYSVLEVERIVRLAAEQARRRRGKLTSVDKANVLAVSRLWRAVAQDVMRDYPDVEFEVMLADAMAMHLLLRPGDFDVVVTSNVFGDLLTDEAAMLCGSLGVVPSASIGVGPKGLYEPVHGSAPDIAGRGIANPVAAILSAAMALRFSLGLEVEARAVEDAVDGAIGDAVLTRDLGGDATTEEFGAAIAKRVANAV